MYEGSFGFDFNTFKSKFIKRYKIDKESSGLIVIYLDKHKEKKKFSNNTLNNIKTDMINQHRIYNQYFLNNCNNRFNIYGLCAIGTGLIGRFTYINDTVLFQMLASGLILLSLALVSQAIFYKIKANKIVKENFYLKNQNYFSDFKLDNSDIIKFLSKRELSLLKESEIETHSIIDLSNLDNISLKTLKKIRKNIMNESKNKIKRKVKKQFNKTRLKPCFIYDIVSNFF